jgi:hypothetical protein
VNELHVWVALTDDIYIVSRKYSCSLYTHSAELWGRVQISISAQCWKKWHKPAATEEKLRVPHPVIWKHLMVSELQQCSMGKDSRCQQQQQLSTSSVQHTCTESCEEQLQQNGVIASNFLSQPYNTPEEKVDMWHICFFAYHHFQCW